MSTRKIPPIIDRHACPVHSKKLSRHWVALLVALTALITPGTVPLSPTPHVVTSAPDTAISPTTRWSWPIAGPRVLARAYLAPPTRYGSGHRGIDVWLEFGEPVLAPEDGVVHFVGVIVDRAVISIEHAGGLISSFEPVTSTLSNGAAVTRGEVIGALGSYGPSASKLGVSQSGHCGAPCLHIGARLHGQYVSPLRYLGGIPHSVLLPTRALR